MSTAQQAVIAIVSTQSSSTTKSLEDAIAEFQEILSLEERAQLERIKDVPDQAAIITFTASLDRLDLERRGMSVASRLYSLLQSIQQFTGIVDTFVSSNPTIAALIWGCVKLAFMIIGNIASYFESLSEMFVGFERVCPRLTEYQLLFPNSEKLRRSLCGFHASVIRCCKAIVLTTRRPFHKQALKVLTSSFQAELQPYINKIKSDGKEVHKEIELAESQEQHRDREFKLQKKERQEAANGRNRALSWISKTDQSMENGRLAFKRKNEVKHAKFLLDSLSTYDYHAAFNSARRKRHPGTGDWITEMPQFAEWFKSRTGSAFVLHGKIGSGKTILTASVVENLFQLKESGQTVLFFFPEFNRLESTKIEGVLRCLIGQNLEPQIIPISFVNALDAANKSMFDIGQLLTLFRQRITLSKETIVVMDGLDEYEADERKTLLEFLQSPSISTENQPPTSIKYFFSCRQSVREEIRAIFPSVSEISTESEGASSDRIKFMRETLDKKRKEGKLVIKDLNLFEEILSALASGGESMFLWISLVIQDICAKRSDSRIRKALQDLPRDLPATFDRALRRIIENRNEEIAADLFRWTAAAKRPLTLEELQEALSIQIGQQTYQSDQLINGIERLESWCENLVEVEEETSSVRFIHHSVEQYLLSSNMGPPELHVFHGKLKDHDHHLGDICVTYLDVLAVKRPLVKAKTAPAQSEKIRSPNLSRMTETALAQVWGSKTSVVLGKLAKGVSRSKSTADKSISQLETSLPLLYSSTSELRAKTVDHNFTDYAQQFWLHHTQRFEKGKSRTWITWLQMINGQHNYARLPWKQDIPTIGSKGCNPISTDMIERMAKVLHDDNNPVGWAVENNHWALIVGFLLESRFFTPSTAPCIFGYLLTRDDDENALFESFAKGLTHKALINSLGRALAICDPKRIPKLLAASQICNCAGSTYGLDEDLCQVLRQGSEIPSDMSGSPIADTIGLIPRLRKLSASYYGQLLPEMIAQNPCHRPYTMAGKSMIELLAESGNMLNELSCVVQDDQLHASNSTGINGEIARKVFYKSIYNAARLAVLRGNEPEAIVLLAAGPTIDAAFIESAINRHWSDRFSVALLDAIKAFSCDDYINGFTCDGHHCLLYEAIHQENWRLAQILLKAGASYETTSRGTRETPSTLASKKFSCPHCGEGPGISVIFSGTWSERIRFKFCNVICEALHKHGTKALQDWKFS